MDPILGLMFFLACWEGVKYAFGHARAVRRTSRGAHVKQAQEDAGGTLSPSARRRAMRQHDAAWWGREVTHGFPVYRTSWHSSWLAHRTALVQAHAQREASRTSHLETRASILSGLREHRQRQAGAQELIDKALDEAGRQAGGKKAVREAGDELARKRAERAAVPPLPADGVRPTRRIDGKPETEADRRFFDHREAGYTGPLDRDGNIPDPADPQNARALHIFASLDAQGANGTQEAAPETASSNPATEGTPPMATDANYTETVEQAKQLEADLEHALSEIHWDRMGNTVDQLGALLRGDADSLSAAADAADDLREAQKRLQAAHDSVAEFRQRIVRNHGGIKEAVDDSPVDEPAEPEFYTE